MKKYICYLFLVVITFSCQSQKSIYSILKNYIQVDTNNELDYLYVNNNSVKYKTAMDIYTHAFTAYNTKDVLRQTNIKWENGRDPFIFNKKDIE